MCECFTVTLVENIGHSLRGLRDRRCLCAAVWQHVCQSHRALHSSRGSKRLLPPHPPTPAELRRHFVPSALIALPRGTLERREAAGPVTACAEGARTGVPGTWEGPRDLQGLQGSLRGSDFVFIYCSSAIFTFQEWHSRRPDPGAPRARFRSVFHSP